MKIMKKILIILLITFFWINNSFALDETANINWEKYSISKIIWKKKIAFLVQFKIDKKPDLNYKIDSSITTFEWKRTCDNEFEFTDNSMYVVCTFIIDNPENFNKKINFHFEVENKENYETEIEINKNYNILKNVSSFDWILWEDNLDKINFNSKVIDLDVLDTQKEIITKLKSEWKTVIWYINVWAIENYRDDYNDFPKNVVWKTYPGWEDEKFLDVRNYEKFQKLLLNRLDIAKEKWFDGIEPDNMDTYDTFSETWFKIYQWDMEKYLIWLNSEVNKRWMFLIQKNAPELSKRMEKYFDWALLEWAFYNSFSEKFSNYIKSWKTVFNVEYKDNTTKKEFLEKICPKSKEIWFTSILKNRDLDKYILTCDNEKNIIKNNEENNNKIKKNNNKIDNFTDNKKTKEKLINKNLETKINNILDNFYKNLNKKYSNNSKKIIILNRLINKIETLKTKINNPEKLNILNYIEENILKKIDF